MCTDVKKNSTLGIFCDKLMGCGCSTVIEHTPHDRKLEGLNPAGRWVFFLLLFFPTLHHYVVSLIMSLKERCIAMKMMLKVKKQYLAGLPEAK